MRFGLFGTGPWAHMTHAPALAAHDRVEFVGVWGRDASKSAALAGEYRVKSYAEVEQLIDAVDAVAIALPPDVQAPIALQAAAAGKHLLLDKPIALTAAAADDIAAAVDASGVASVVFLTHRFVPQVREFLEEAGRSGGWVHSRVDYVSSIREPGNPFGASPWRHESGGLWDVGPHALALLLPVLGAVTEVAAMYGPHDTTHVLLAHGSGAVSALTLSVHAPPAAARWEAVFTGAAGILAMPTAKWDPIAAYAHALDEVLAAAAGGPRSPVDARFGAALTTILAAAEESARTGARISLA